TSSPISTLDISGNLSVSGSTNSSIDTSTFFVDATNNRVGVGTTTPNESLGIVGNIQLTGNVTPVAPPIVGNSTQTITTVESTNDILGTSITIAPDGLPIISYYNYSGGVDTFLKIVKCGNTACSSGNTITAIEQVGILGNLGDRTSITIGTDGLPIVSYFNATTSDLKVLKCGNVYCNTGNTITTVASTNTVGRYSSIKIGPDGLPRIFYYDTTNGDPRLLICGSQTCSSGNSDSQLDGVNDRGSYGSLAIGVDGMPIVAEYDASNSDLMVHYCQHINCSTGGITTLVDNDAADVGRFTSITIAQDGLPIIAYRDVTNTDLKVVKCGNIACTTGNTKTTVDSTANNVGFATSITIPSDGLPVISYLDNSDQDLMVIKCGNVNCSSGNTKTNVDTSGNVGDEGYISIGTDGLPIIAYRDVTNTDLKVVKCATPNCNQTSSGSYTFGSNLGTIGNFWNNIYSNQFWGKKFQIAAFDVAEKYSSSESLQPGDVVRIDPNGGSNVLKTNGPYQKVAGIISTNPAITLGNWENQDGYPIALAGRVPVKATNENGAINKGDVLVSSSKSGYAMKCSNNNDIDCFGATIGKALEPCNSNECKILVLVSR
ncbi:MAG: hypothetical protein HYW33_03280, partial [Candidatus Blackburnbacteria bacterium]|nr:hypothetical protein [Candidatus Blackburnbacteria bacterium]